MPLGAKPLVYKKAIVFFVYSIEFFMKASHKSWDSLNYFIIISGLGRDLGDFSAYPFQIEYWAT